nr:complexin isoform X1 [Crassostrea gigas]XP_011417705.1 complexin isoform X1 [Crassostrea gigas]XP_011417708.1 complexin isoform X1 [Crassostrea gigas]XP_011417709.1 complexin isoform X1 [Crassostrea gigas]XP_011417710.1 complexin isoform X1 [Crassostrea gigas]XP_011417711.1 complexin isoform X1 [Crassostrea gigas]XP_034328647.1 complexin isoform X1 [Crassostrea gigas]|eukprot:XP_011417704.1 PREDICTED: complexin isoform X1 [Crassostrea gigas]
MAAFIAKQMVGNQLKSVKDKLSGAIGGGDKEGEGENKEDAGGGGEDPEVEEMRREAERKRKEKHEKAEAEREELRQSIRDKYGLKKKVPEEENMMLNNDDGGRVGRKKKTPAELAAEANADSDDDEFTMPKNMDELKNKVQDIPQKLAQSVGEVTEKCSLQ